MKLYKTLQKDGKAPYTDFKWSLPVGDQPGEWMPAVDGDLIQCENGYHLCREKDLVEWLNAEIYEAEYRGEIVEADNKVVVREARLLRKVETWTDRTARLFACDCAERVLHIYEDAYPDDNRPRQAVDTARRYANGEATQEELGAAEAAADAAALAAAWAAALAAAWAAAAWAAARAAARAAAWAAAWAAAQAATWDAEQSWQTKRLFEYLRGER